MEGAVLLTVLVSTNGTMQIERHCKDIYILITLNWNMIKKHGLVKRRLEKHTDSLYKRLNNTKRAMIENHRYVA